MSFPTTLSGNDLARLFSVDRRTITNWVNSTPPLPRRQDGKQWRYHLPDVLAWWQARHAVQARPVDRNEAEERLAIAKAELAELELGEARGNLARREDVAREWNAMLERFAARLRSLPAKAAPALLGMRRPPEAQVVLERYLEEALAEMRDYDC